MPRPTRNHAELRVTFDGWLEFREVSGLVSGAISLCVVEWCIAGPVGAAGIIVVFLHDIVAAHRKALHSGSTVAWPRLIAGGWGFLIRTVAVGSPLFVFVTRTQNRRPLIAFCSGILSAVLYFCLAAACFLFHRNA